MTLADELTDAAAQLRTFRVDPPPSTRALRRRSTRRRGTLTIAIIVLVLSGTLLLRQPNDTNVVDVITNQPHTTAWISYGASLLELNPERVTRHEPDHEQFTPIYEVVAVDDTHFAARVANTVTLRAADGTIVRTIGDGQLIAGPNDSLWLANGLNSTISHIDTTTFATEERLTISYPNTSIVAITTSGVLVSEAGNRALIHITWDGRQSTILDQPYRYAFVNRAGNRIAFALASQHNRLEFAELPTDTEPLRIYANADIPPVFNATWSPDDTTLGLILVTGDEDPQSDAPRFVPSFIDGRPLADAEVRMVPAAATHGPGQIVWITSTLAYHVGDANAALIELSTDTPKIIRQQTIGAQTDRSSTPTQSSSPATTTR